MPKGVAAAAVMDGVQIRVLVSSTSGRGAPISTTTRPHRLAQLGLLTIQAAQAGSGPLSPGLENPPGPCPPLSPELPKAPAGSLGASPV